MGPEGSSTGGFAGGEEPAERPGSRSNRMRLQKFLSRAGVASRRHSETMIRAGRVRVNGAVVTEMGAKVDPSGDRVEVDGRAVDLGERVWVLVHKPPGYVTTRDDPWGRPTVYSLLPADYDGLFHVGRLDLDSEGLLLLTNEGGTANRLLHPRHEVDRVYRVECAGEPAAAVLERLRAGVELEDGPARAHAAERLDDGSVRVVMREGRKREVRRLFEAVGHPVRRLIRERFGPVSLRGLEPGEWRPLTDAEVAELREL